MLIYLLDSYHKDSLFWVWKPYILYISQMLFLLVKSQICQKSFVIILSTLVHTSNDVIDILHLLLQTKSFIDIYNNKKQPKKCKDLRSLLKRQIPNQTRNVINKLIIMEQITNEISPARIATLDHESEKEGSKLRDLVNNGLSSSIKSINKDIVKKFANFNKDT